MYYVNTMIQLFWKTENYGASKKTSGCLVLEEGEREGGMDE